MLTTVGSSQVWIYDLKEPQKKKVYDEKGGFVGEIPNGNEFRRKKKKTGNIKHERKAEHRGSDKKDEEEIEKGGMNIFIWS